MTSAIAQVEVIPIVAPEQARDDLDGTVETVIVRITDADGRHGIGETDAPATVVKSFIEMHGGRIVLSSRPGEGTTVSFVMPAGAAQGATDAPAAIGRLEPSG